MSAEHPYCPTCVCGRRAPVQGERRRGIANGSVAWTEHEQAWAVYSAHCPGQSAQYIAERGGFSYGELVEFLGHEPTTFLAGERGRP